MKAITLKGCADCPYCRPNTSGNMGWACRRFDIVGHGKDTPPETPHQNCKLNDLPSESDIIEMAENTFYYAMKKYGFSQGANYIIEQISKETK